MIITYVLIGSSSKPLRNHLGRFVSPKFFVRPADPKTPAIEKNPIVKFWYPMSKTPWNSSMRRVRVISSTAKHLIGLEQNPDTGKWQFKKYLQEKLHDMKMEFNEGAMR